MHQTPIQNGLYFLGCKLLDSWSAIIRFESNAHPDDFGSIAIYVRNHPAQVHDDPASLSPFPSRIFLNPLILLQLALREHDKDPVVYAFVRNAPRKYSQPTYILQSRDENESVHKVQFFQFCDFYQTQSSFQVNQNQWRRVLVWLFATHDTIRKAFLIVEQSL